MAHMYILYSALLNKYYVGATGDDVRQSLRRHNSPHKGFTGKARDWVLVHAEPFDSYENALKREREVKRWKSCSRIEALVDEGSQQL